MMLKNRRLRSVDRWVDVSNAPLKKDDILKLYNESNEVHRTFQIKSVEEDDENNRRMIVATVVDTTDPNERVNVTVDFFLPRAQPVLGSVLRLEDQMGQLSSQEMQDVASLELYKWLMSRYSANYGARFRKCVEFLVNSNLIPDDEPYADQQNRLRALMKRRPELFRSAGGVIFGTGMSVDGDGIRGGKRLSGDAIVIRRIKLSKLYMGIRQILESGLFGEIIIEE